MMKVMFLLSAYSTYFSGIPTTITTKSQVSGYSGKIYVYDSWFISLTSSSSSAISLSGSMEFLCENSIFRGCISQSGAVVTITGTSTGVVFNQVCVSACYNTATGWVAGQFCYVSDSSISILEYISVIECSPANVRTGSDPIVIYYGNQKIANTNCSENYVIQEACLLCAYAAPVRIIHSNFADNHPVSIIGLYFYHGEVYLESCNIVNNYGPGGYGIYTNQQATGSVKYCVCSSNDGVLFYAQTATTTLENNWISHVGQVYTGPVSVISSYSGSASYALELINNNLCFIDIKPLKVPSPNQISHPKIIFNSVLFLITC